MYETKRFYKFTRTVFYVDAGVVYQGDSFLDGTPWHRCPRYMMVPVGTGSFICSNPLPLLITRRAHFTTSMLSPVRSWIREIYIDKIQIMKLNLFLMFSKYFK